MNGFISTSVIVSGNKIDDDERRIGRSTCKVSRIETSCESFVDMLIQSASSYLADSVLLSKARIFAEYSV